MIRISRVRSFRIISILFMFMCLRLADIPRNLINRFYGSPLTVYSVSFPTSFYVCIPLYGDYPICLPLVDETDMGDAVFVGEEDGENIADSRGYLLSVICYLAGRIGILS